MVAVGHGSALDFPSTIGPDQDFAPFTQAASERPNGRLTLSAYQKQVGPFPKPREDSNLDHRRIAKDYYSSSTQSQRRPIARSPLSPAALQLERRIERHEVELLEHLRTQLSREDLDLETVQVCLGTYLRLRLANLGHKKCIEAIPADRVGGLVLQWLW